MQKTYRDTLFPGHTWWKRTHLVPHGVCKTLKSGVECIGFPEGKQTNKQKPQTLPYLLVLFASSTPVLKHSIHQKSPAAAEETKHTMVTPETWNHSEALLPEMGFEHLHGKGKAGRQANQSCTLTAFSLWNSKAQRVPLQVKGMVICLSKFPSLTSRKPVGAHPLLRTGWEGVLYY